MGDEFLACVEAALASANRTPAAFARVHGDVRRRLIQRFPYAVFYLPEGRDLVVLAVLHCGRDPPVWRDRR